MANEPAMAIRQPPHDARRDSPRSPQRADVLPPEQDKTEPQVDGKAASIPTKHTFTLSRPIEVHGGSSGPRKVSELTFRFPCADDVFDLPLPYRTYSQQGRMEITPDGPALRTWMERLSENRYSRMEIGTMAARDLMAIYNWLCEEINAPAGN